MKCILLLLLHLTLLNKIFAMYRSDKETEIERERVNWSGSGQRCGMEKPYISKRMTQFICFDCWLPLIVFVLWCWRIDDLMTLWVSFGAAHTVNPQLPVCELHRSRHFHSNLSLCLFRVFTSICCSVFTNNVVCCFKQYEIEGMLFCFCMPNPEKTSRDHEKSLWNPV